MVEDNQKNDVHLILGQILGEMKGIAASQTQLFSTVTLHTASDEKNFKEIREEIADVRAEIADGKIRMAYYMGGASVIGALAGWLIPFVIEQLIQ